jgi:uncharacterized membrane-anchored protein
MNLRLFVLIPLALIQLAVPGWMICRQEQILKHGRVFKFKTAPVDPYDAFRGRYVALRFAIESPLAKSSPGHLNKRVWVRIEADGQGFAKIKEECNTPLTGDDVVTATRPFGMLHFPFDRYYMDETAAPKAETAYRTNSRREQQNAYATVRVLNGRAALEELYIDDKPIRDFLREDSKK